MQLSFATLHILRDFCSGAERARKEWLDLVVHHPGVHVECHVLPKANALFLKPSRAIGGIAGHFIAIDSPAYDEYIARQKRDAERIAQRMR